MRKPIGIILGAPVYYWRLVGVGFGLAAGVIALFSVVLWSDGNTRRAAFFGALIVSACGGWWIISRVLSGERDIRQVRRDYLASLRVPCPRCTYPLEDVFGEDTGVKCPECGWVGGLDDARSAWHRVLWIRSARR